jgi:hypothetical protein
MKNSMLSTINVGCSLMMDIIKYVIFMNVLFKLKITGEVMLVVNKSIVILKITSENSIAQIVLVL